MITSSYPPVSENVLFKSSFGSSSYPENQSVYALTTLLGVSIKPSRLTSSPAHLISVRTASSASFLDGFLFAFLFIISR